jgi:hypothetical protein
VIVPRERSVIPLRLKGTLASRPAARFNRETEKDVLLTSLSVCEPLENLSNMFRQF